MFKSFNQLLIERVQQYFQKRCGVDITEEQAEEYLHSLADIYEIFIGLSDEGTDPPIPP
jgi:hypothetical protein